MNWDGFKRMMVAVVVYPATCFVRFVGSRPFLGRTIFFVLKPFAFVAERLVTLFLGKPDNPLQRSMIAVFALPVAAFLFLVFLLLVAVVVRVAFFLD